ncbi:Uncharacterised protein [Sphingobacterium multivorum]|uniref:hypothetical protein n=1 Tax=Sphingobacterium multivorum TaxID=28454 RepID=UPI000E06B513|nr:hypothetical protein [Sphingobacterium multivorum]QQT44883.1 hypothetical protein I6J00_24835 [Sphingobacterium multivorum]SUJ18261.1 Uncharacterised protein [Sphingobacterium multivorum]
MNNIAEFDNIFLNLDSPQSIDRNRVIHISSIIESVISNMLSMAIGDQDRKSKSFGYGSESLSFNARINLLIDFNVLENDEKAFLQKFMEIRNKFAHNFHTKSLHVLLVDHKENGLLKFLEKHFKCEIDNYEISEENSWKLFNLLVSKIESSLNKVYMYLIERAQNMAANGFRNNFYEIFQEILGDLDFIRSLSGSPLNMINQIYAKINEKLAETVKTPEEAFKDMKGKSLF